MAEVGIPPLVAAEGRLAVVYGTAAYLFGKWSVTLPDGYKKVDSQGNPDTMEYGRGLGYVGQLDNPPAADDLGARRWLRADISTHYDIVRDAMSNRIVEEYRATNVPDTFDAAEKRTSGDHLFDGTIGPEGMGKVRLGVDFFVGDEVPVLVGGVKLLSLPVTEGAESSEPGAELMQQVRVGGELTEQPAALLEHETAVMQVLAQESIQRRKEAEQRRKDEAQRREDREQWREIGQTADTLKSQQRTISDQQYTLFGQQGKLSNQMGWTKQMMSELAILATHVLTNRNYGVLSYNRFAQDERRWKRLYEILGDLKANLSNSDYYLFSPSTYNHFESVSSGANDEGLVRTRARLVSLNSSLQNER